MGRKAVLAAGAGRLVAASVMLACLGAVGTSQAQESPAFPASLEREPLLLWLQRETDIGPDRVVAVTPQALTSIVSTFPAGGGQGPRVVIRAEALSAETYARTGALSWHVSLTADCQGRRVRLGETTGYPQRNLLGERRLLRPAETDWRAPERGTALDNAWRAACEPGFKGPFAANALKVAQESAPAARPSPPSAAPAINADAPAAPAPAARPEAATPAPAPKAKPAVIKGPSGGVAAQVGASPSDADARRLLAGLGPAGAERQVWVEKAEVAGRIWHRAMVGGFGDAREAGAFCATLKAHGRDCFVRGATR